MAQKDYRAQRQDYKTPPSIYEPILELLNRYKFDMDVCCSEPNIPAHQYIMAPENGLIASWCGFCFMNPPFKFAKYWITKAVAEAAKGVVVFSVLPADRLETNYYQQLILKNEDCMFAFLPGKVGFIIPGREDEEIKPSQKIMIVVFANRGLIRDLSLMWNLYRPFNSVAFKGVPDADLESQEKPKGSSVTIRNGTMFFK